MAEAERAFDERRGAGASANIVNDLDAKAEELNSLERALTKLRTEQDRAAAAGEGALKIRLKREELFAKVGCCNFRHGLKARFQVESLVQVDTHVKRVWSQGLTL